MDVQGIRLGRHWVETSDATRTAFMDNPTTARLRRTKMTAALAIAMLVGIGSYAATLRALDLVSEPAATTTWVAPASADSHVPTTVPAPLLAHPGP